MTFVYENTMRGFLRMWIFDSLQLYTWPDQLYIDAAMNFGKYFNGIEIQSEILDIYSALGILYYLDARLQ